METPMFDQEYDKRVEELKDSSISSYRRIIGLSQKLALESSKGALDSFCVRTHGYYQTDDTPSVPEEAEWISDAVTFLTLMGLIEVHPKHSNWVKVK